MPQQRTKHKRGQPAFLLVGTLVALLLASLPVSLPAASQQHHAIKVNSLEYKRRHGFWEVLDIPEEFKTNTIHAAALPTGKILLVAGSGNNREKFNQFHDEGMISVLATAVFDPITNNLTMVETPSDLFCSGHTLLQSGSLLIAGGTSGYELLEGAVTKPAGAMVIHNEDPDSSTRIFKKGTKLTSPSGKIYITTQDVTVEPATKIDHGAGNVMIHHSSAKVFVEAIAEDASYITDSNEQYTIEGLTGTDTHNIYGQGGPMTLAKQDYRGDNKAYEFDPLSEKYIQVGDMKESRWYASLPILTNGEVLAVSGLDNVGIITETTEFYSPVTKQWRWGPNQEFPTYPALFRTNDPDVLFFSGSSSGYGPVDKGRQPGFWNIRTDTFQPVPGLRDFDLLETSASVALPPPKGSNDGTQSYKIMVAGGGGIGESPLSTDRVDIIDLAAENPRFVPGPSLPTKLRYPNLTVTPWDEVFAAGGSIDYRAKHNSYSHKAFSINPVTSTIAPMADEIVGRNYHSGSLLLRDGRILVFGGDPLFNDKYNTVPGMFEQRIEIFTPPQFFHSERPVFQGPDAQRAKRGDTLTFGADSASPIQTARLIPPSSTTHVTNIEQRSVAAIATQENNTVSIALPADENLLPNGWYMLFVTNADGMPSHAKMIHVAD